MSFIKQRKIVEALMRIEKIMIPKDKDMFKMLFKRHIDDEDFDKESFDKLLELYEKYIVNKPKPSLDNLFKK